MQSPPPPRSRLTAAVFASAVFASACGGSFEPARDLGEFEAHLEAMRTALHIPGMTAVIAKGQSIVWSHGFGFADVEAGIPATDTTAYHLASLTKTFASTIIMQLVESGQLDLDAPVTSFGITLPGGSAIHVRHLMTHTSEGVPGAAFQYNGDRFALLGTVIKSVSGSTFGQLLEQKILAPLALKHTAPNPLDLPSFSLSGLDHTTFVSNLAQGYTTDGAGRLAYPGSFSVSAGLVASAVDVARYSMAVDANQFVTVATQAQAWTPFVTNGGQAAPYGLGWFVTTIGGHKLIWHYGYWTANSSLIIKDPDRGLTFVLLANSDMLSRPTSLGAGNLLSSRAAAEFVNAFILGSATLP